MNTTQSSCDYSMSQFKDDPLSELPPDEESEEDLPLVISCILVLLSLCLKLIPCDKGGSLQKTDNLFT